MFLPPTGTPDALLLPDPVRVRDLTEWLGASRSAPVADELSAVRLSADGLSVSVSSASGHGVLPKAEPDAGQAS